MNNHIVLIGAHRMASRIMQVLSEKKENFVVVDFNPDRVKHLLKKKINCIYGDYGNMYVLENVNIKDAKVVISTVPNLNDNIKVIKMVRESNKKGLIIVTAHKALDALLLYREGADFVVFPEYLSGQKVSDYLIHLNLKNIKKWGKYYRKQLVDEITTNHLFM